MMNAKSKADFIHAVAGGGKIPCPNCNTLNEADSKFCITCGTKLVRPESKPEEDLPFRKVDQDPPVQKPEGDLPFRKVEPPAEPVTGTAQKEVPFQTVSDAKQASETKQEVPYVVYAEPKSVFAEGLPEWSIEPPQVVVRRKRSR